MPAVICDDPSMCEAVLKKEVVVMENSSATKEAIKEVMEGELGWTVRIAKNSDEVAAYARNKEAAIFILDNKIGNNPTEGLDALEKINNINKDILVAIFSAYPSYKNQAEKINNNLVIYEVKQDGTSLKENVRHIETAFVNRVRLIINEIQREIENSDDENKKLELERNRKKLEEAYLYNNPNFSNINCNFEAYEKYQSDEKWLTKYEGKYVAFVGGEQVFPEITDEQELLKLIREKYPQKSQLKLFTKVQKVLKNTNAETDEADTMIDLPNSLDIFYKFE